MTLVEKNKFNLKQKKYFYTLILKKMVAINKIDNVQSFFK